MKIKRLHTNRQNTALLLCTIASGLVYFLLTHPREHSHVLATSLDKHIPFVPVFIVPYLLFLLVFWLVIVWAYIKNRQFRPLALTVIIVYLISYIVYFVFPTHVIRPQVSGHDIFSDIVRWLYRHDASTSAFPSSHSSSATIMAIYFLLTGSRWRWLALGFSGLVVLSTLFVKQHVVPDVASGVALGTVVALILFRANFTTNPATDTDSEKI